MTGRAVAKLIVATVVVTTLTWAWWAVDPGAPDGVALPVALTALLAGNVALTTRSHRLKRTLVVLFQRYVLNPPIKLALRVGVPLGYALLETTGRVSGKPRRTPVGNGRDGDTLWIVAEHGHQAGYVRNIKANPRVRVRLRAGWRVAWFTGTAHVLLGDDPYARQRTLSRWRPFRALNAMVVRVMGTHLLTIRIDLDPSSAPAPSPTLHRTDPDAGHSGSKFEGQRMLGTMASMSAGPGSAKARAS